MNFLKKPTSDSQPQCSRFPGVATRRRDGSIPLVKATIVYVSPEGRTQVADPKSRFFGFRVGTLQHLIGESYTFVCENCRVSICNAIRPSMDAVQKATGMGIVEAAAFPRCPYCFQKLSDLKVGEKVLLHHRYQLPTTDKDGNITQEGWGMWFAERWDW